MDETEGQKLNVKFITKLPDPLRLPDQSYVVPAEVNRRGLSTIVNHLLGRELENARVFDFLIHGQLLRTNLTEWLSQYEKTGKSDGKREEIIQLEYIDAVRPPQPRDSLNHDDWVSSVSARVEGFFASGCYDQKLRIWNRQTLEPVATVHAHAAPISEVLILSKDIDSAGNIVIASAAKDQIAKIWKVNVRDGSAHEMQSFEGHVTSIEAIAAEPRRHNLATGSFDGAIGVWRLPAMESSRTESKKRKTDSNTEAGTISNALMTLKGHTQAITGLLWPLPHQLISGSWDHTIRLWDAEAGVATSTLSGSKAINDIAFSPLNNLVAAAHHNGSVSIWDPRANEGKLLQQSLVSHKAWVSAVVFHPNDESILVSAAYDSTVKLWDLRSPVPLSTLSAHSDKVLCVDFDRDGNIISGGADNKVFVYGSKAE